MKHVLDESKACKRQTGHDGLDKLLQLVRDHAATAKEAAGNETCPQGVQMGISSGARRSGCADKTGWKKAETPGSITKVVAQ